MTAGDRWKTYDRAAVQREFVSVMADGTREAQLLVQGVRCAACSWLIERAMAAVPGVRESRCRPADDAHAAAVGR